jgi:hypothetical protein
MQSQIQQLFRLALGLAEPWVVSKIEFSDEQHQLDLWLDFPGGSKFPCPRSAAGPVAGSTTAPSGPGGT